MIEKPEQPDASASIEMYLDGRMSPAEQRAFEARMKRDPELARLVKLQQAIDASLQRMYAPRAGDEAEAAQHLKQLHSLQQSGPYLRIPVYAAAIAAVVLLTAGLFIWIELRPPTPFSEGPPRQQSMEQSERPVGPPARYFVGAPQEPENFYQSHLESGFRALWACPPNVLADVTRDRFDAEATYHLPDDHEHLQVVGAYYVHVFSRRTVGLFVRTDEDVIVAVLIDRHENVDTDPGIIRDEAGQPSLFVHARTSGPLAFYEISPLDEPQALRFFQTLDSGG